MRYSRQLLLIAMATLVGACSASTTVEPFQRPDTAQVDYSFVSPNADFGKYTALLLYPLEIYYPNNAPQPPPEDLDRLRQYFREAFLAALRNDYRLTTLAAEDVLRVNAQIIDLKIVGERGTYQPSEKLREIVAAGELTFLMELQDSMTRTTLARAGDNTATGQLAAPAGQDASWDQVRVAAERWAGLFRAFLDRNVQGARRR
jgi:hypothetical protein